MKCIRVVGFVAALAVPLAAPAQETARKGMRTASQSDLEKQLYEIDQKWLEAARTQNLKFLKQLWTDRLFEILPGDAGRVRAPWRMISSCRRFTETSSLRPIIRL